MDLIQDIIYAIGEYRGEGVASTFGIRVDADGNATSLDVVEHYRPWKEFAIGMTRWRYVVAMVLTFSYVLLRASREIQRSK
ncbi:MAG: hypothetical protein H6765_08740 [Candidatus Peribacteria bacterium]|nr:MAG: hypothetical protein H6765_08740 [Candidatus Peribacteria bacterium]